MGRLLDHKSCSGCMACYSVCPVKCISVVQDADGFYLPQIDQKSCINCSKCEKACAKANGKGDYVPMFGKAFSTKDEKTLARSSSGGVFTALAAGVLAEGGVVYGAGYDEAFQVRHIRVDAEEDLRKLNGSKYVQSHIGDSLISAKEDLKAGRKVLFSGTPCQVAGLIACLPEKYRENLLAVDFICHGVPTPKAWEAYLGHMQTSVGKVQSVNMRDHRLGQDNYGMCIAGEKDTYFQSCGQDPYLVAFNHNLTLRSSCFQCKHKKITCQSDITMGDLWGGKAWISPERYTGHHSLVIANSPKGAQCIKNLDRYGSVDPIPLAQALRVNAARFYPSGKIHKKTTAEVVKELADGTFTSK